MLNRKIFKNKIIKAGLVVLGLILVLVIINSITYKPFIWTFKGLMNKVAIQGNVGSWENEIAAVNEIGTETIPIEGYPESQIFLYGTAGIENQPLIIYIHGGGWCTGTTSSVEWYAKLLSSNGYMVANVDYALAPEYKYPISTCQLVEVVNYLYENADKYGYDKNCIFIAGNSAGAHLSSQLGAIFTNPEFADLLGVDVRVPADSIRGLILYNGVYNFDTAGECNFPFFDKLVWAYTGVKKYIDYDKIDEISTIKHITPSYPPVFITVGDADPLEAQTLEFINELQKNDTVFHSLLWTGTESKLWHDYIYEQNTEEAVKAYEETIAFIQNYR